MFFVKKIDKYSMPIPMITLIQNGKGYNGKQNLIKEFIILPKPHLSIQEVKTFISSCHFCSANIFSFFCKI